MYNQKRHSRAKSGYGGKKFGGPRKDGYKKPYNRDSGERDAFDAVCGECGADCRVPFRPNGSKPVLCMRCFKKDDRRDDRPQKRFGGDRFSRPSGGNDNEIAVQLRQINKKLDLIINSIETEGIE